MDLLKYALRKAAELKRRGDSACAAAGRSLHRTGFARAAASERPHRTGFARAAAAVRPHRTGFARAAAAVLGAFALALLVFTCAGVPAEAADDGYKFNGVWHENNTVSVTEKISVNFLESRHGIYRTIPNRFVLGGSFVGEKDRNYHYAVKVRNVDVEGDDYERDSDNNNTILKIGSSSHTYKFPPDRIDSADMLYYSVLGPSWTTTIKKFAFDMKFDKALPKESLDNFRILSGKAGGTGNALDIVPDVSAKRITGSAENIRPQQAITLFAKLPQGYFKQSGSEGGTVPKICFVLCLIFAVLCVIIAVKNSGHEPVETVEFYPPEGVTPAEDH